MSATRIIQVRRRNSVPRGSVAAAACVALMLLGARVVPAASLRLNKLDYFEAQGRSILTYQNTFRGWIARSRSGTPRLAGGLTR